MDLATLIGIAAAWGAILLSVVLEGGHLSAFVNIPAAIIVFGGSLGATVVGLRMRHVLGLLPVLRQAFFGRPVNSVEVMALLAELTRRARREGVLALEAELPRVEPEFVRNGLRLVVDGTSQDLLRELLETELEAMRARHTVGHGMFTAMGGYAPTLGILGAVIGLIHALGNLQSPEEMGRSIAVAFVATLYGVGSANLLFLPIAAKLKAKSEEEIAAYRVAIEGLLALQAGESARVAAARMQSFLPPRARARAERQVAERV